MIRNATFAAIALIFLLGGCQTPRKPERIVPTSPQSATRTEQAAERPDAENPRPLPEPASSQPQTEFDLYQRLRARLSDPHCDGSEAQQHWLRRYAPQPESFHRQLAPMLPLLDYVLGEIETRQLPGEFALIPIVESHYRPLARSPHGPLGLWQFTRDTAVGFGLKVDREADERVSVVRSTDAALQMLGDLYRSHQDWALAAAGYNAGPYRLRRLLERQPDPQPGPLPAGLARGTYDYIEKLRAWGCLLGEPERHGIELPPLDDVERLVRVPTPPGLKRLSLLAEVTGLSRQQLRHWNPLLQDLPRPHGGSELLLPKASARGWLDFAERVSRGDIAPPAPRLHTVAQGDTLTALAARYGVTVAELQRWNGLEAKALLRIGQTLRLEP